MRILIANRGEIASRIIRTVKRLGMYAIAVYHGEDRNAPFVAEADDALELHADLPSAAYLDIAQIFCIANRTSATAIHPGYGFLAENPEFARSAQASDLLFIGPSPEVMEVMGDKIRARLAAEKAGLPLVPSVSIKNASEATQLHASGLAFPLLIKAAAGGGGRGMRLVRGEYELQDQLDAASREAVRYFQDGRVYLERYLEDVRHIEVQVFGDGKGGALHLGERDCSIQRNYQKLIEETPAPGIDDTLREEICLAALRLVRQTNYAGAGTIEFMLAPDGQYYFLEMNTRLQVEHPVTECVTGLDLVELQIEVAQSGRLPMTQNKITFSGHALEARICAEDPDRNFLPSTGRLIRQVVPQGERIRFDSGVREGQRISASFDSMLGKLVVHDEDRPQTIRLAIKALDQLVLLGLTTNQDFLGRVLSHRAFQDQAPRTNFLTVHDAELRTPSMGAKERDHLLIAALLGARDAIRLAEVSAVLRARLIP